MSSSSFARRAVGCASPLGTRIAPQLSQCAGWRSAHPAHPATSVAGIVRRHPDRCCRRDAPHRSPGLLPALHVQGEQIGRDLGGGLRPRRGLGGGLAVDRGLVGLERDPGAIDVGLGRLDPGPEPGELPVDRLRRSISSSSRSSRARWWRWSCSTSACIAWSSRGEVTEPEYIAASTSFTFSADATASSSSRRTSRATTSRRSEASVSGPASAWITPSARVSTWRSGRFARRCRSWSRALSCSWTTRSCSSDVISAAIYRSPSPVLPTATGHSSRRW